MNSNADPKRAQRNAATRTRRVLTQALVLAVLALFLVATYATSLPQAYTAQAPGVVVVRPAGAVPAPVVQVVAQAPAGRRRPARRAARRKAQTPAVALVTPSSCPCGQAAGK